MSFLLVFFLFLQPFCIFVTPGKEPGGLSCYMVIVCGGNNVHGLGHKKTLMYCNELDREGGCGWWSRTTGNIWKICSSAGTGAHLSLAGDMGESNQLDLPPLLHFYGMSLVV